MAIQDVRIYSTGNAVPSRKLEDFYDTCAIRGFLVNDTSGDDVYNRTGGNVLKSWYTLTLDLTLGLDQVNSNTSNISDLDIDVSDLIAFKNQIEQNGLRVETTLYDGTPQKTSVTTSLPIGDFAKIRFYVRWNDGSSAIYIEECEASVATLQSLASGQNFVITRQVIAGAKDYRAFIFIKNVVGNTINIGTSDIGAWSTVGIYKVVGIK